MMIELYHTPSDLKTRFRKEKDPRLAVRIRAVYLGLMGKTAPEIAVLLGYSRRAIQTWIQAYNRNGLEGLRDTPGRGTRCKLNPDQLQWLRQRLEEGPRPDEGICVMIFTFDSPAVWRTVPLKFHLYPVKAIGLQLCIIPAGASERGSTSPPELLKKSVIRSGNLSRKWPPRCRSL